MLFRTADNGVRGLPLPGGRDACTTTQRRPGAGRRQENIMASGATRAGAGRRP
ncbi:hypothetical protein HGI15_18305 [Modestobacter lapidis]|nr:hypothetical protein [Modestobacter lapidis]